MKTEHEKTYGVKEFIPQDHNPTPWRVVEMTIWHQVIAANNKRVCNCRNIKDAELIVRLANSAHHDK